MDWNRLEQAVICWNGLELVGMGLNKPFYQSLNSYRITLHGYRTALPRLPIRALHGKRGLIAKLQICQISPVQPLIENKLVKIWKALYLGCWVFVRRCCHAGDSYDVTLAFEDAQVIQFFSMEETDDTDIADDTDDTDYTDDTDNTDDTDDRDDTEQAGIGWNRLEQAGVGRNRLEWAKVGLNRLEQA